MARKDTMKALINRDVSEETAALLLTKYSSLSAISNAGEAELVELGLMEEEARSVLAKIGKRPASEARVLVQGQEGGGGGRPRGAHGGGHQLLPVQRG